MTQNHSPASTLRLVTLGCAKNLVDSERLARQLEKNGWHIVFDDDKREASVVIINTCGFINDAKQESIDTILRYVELRQKGKISMLLVMGCLTERYHEELKKGIPEADAFFGVNDFRAIIKTLGGIYKKENPGDRLLATPSHYAYLKIAEGCNRRCSFCAIPSIRGKYQSLPLSFLVKEAQHLVSKGVKELILVAQDLSYYGYDIERSRLLPQLVRQLSSIKGLQWLRLHYAYPTGFPEEILDLMAGKSNVCHYLDIPFQHISTPVLQRMRRGYDETKVKKLIELFRTRVPDIALRTSLIVGFPGETEKDFRKLYDFVRNTRFERLGIFMYSHEEGTWAFHHFNDSIPEKVKQQRYHELMKLQQAISLQMNKEKIGTSAPVLIDRIEKNTALGRTQYDSPEIDNQVIISPVKGKEIKAGNFYPVTFSGASAYDLYGSL